MPGGVPPSVGPQPSVQLAGRGGGHALMHWTSAAQPAFDAHACSWEQQASSAMPWQEDGKSGGKKASPQAPPLVLPDPELLLLDPEEPEEPEPCLLYTS